MELPAPSCSQPGAGGCTKGQPLKVGRAHAKRGRACPGRQQLRSGKEDQEDPTSQGSGRRRGQGRSVPMAGGGKAPVSPRRRRDAGFGMRWGTVMIPAPAAGEMPWHRGCLLSSSSPQGAKHLTSWFSAGGSGDPTASLSSPLPVLTPPVIVSPPGAGAEHTPHSICWVREVQSAL